jgi:hypothetical protein
MTFDGLADAFDILGGDFSSLENTTLNGDRLTPAVTYFRPSL